MYRWALTLTTKAPLGWNMYPPPCACRISSICFTHQDFEFGYRQSPLLNTTSGCDCAKLLRRSDESCNPPRAHAASAQSERGKLQTPRPKSLVWPASLEKAQVLGPAHCRVHPLHDGLDRLRGGARMDFVRMEHVPPPRAHAALAQSDSGIRV